MLGSISILSISVISLHSNVVIRREVICDILGLYTGYYIHILVHTELTSFSKCLGKLVIDNPLTSSNTLEINCNRKIYIHLNKHMVKNHQDGYPYLNLSLCFENFQEPHICWKN